MLGGCGGLFYAWWMFWASESAKATLEETIAPVVALLLSAVSWVKDCVQALVARITGAIPAQALLCTRMTRHIAGYFHAPLACLLDCLLWLKALLAGWKLTHAALPLCHAGRQRRADAAEAFFQPLASGDFGLDGNEEELGQAPPVLR